VVARDSQLRTAIQVSVVVAKQHIYSILEVKSSASSFRYAARNAEREEKEKKKERKNSPNSANLFAKVLQDSCLSVRVSEKITQRF